MTKLKKGGQSSLIKSIAQNRLFSDMQNIHFLGRLRILRNENIYFHILKLDDFID